jgi:hypothetical protein
MIIKEGYVVSKIINTRFLFKLESRSTSADMSAVDFCGIYFHFGTMTFILTQPIWIFQHSPRKIFNRRIFSWKDNGLVERSVKKFVFVRSDLI